MIDVQSPLRMIGFVGVLAAGISQDVAAPLLASASQTNSLLPVASQLANPAPGSADQVTNPPLPGQSPDAIQVPATLNPATNPEVGVNQPLNPLLAAASQNTNPAFTRPLLASVNQTMNSVSGISAAPGTNQGFVESVLVTGAATAISNTAANGPVMDPRLANPWGLVVGPGVEWTGDNGSGLATVYGAAGLSFADFDIGVPGIRPGRGRPTGLAFNETGQFVITNTVGTNGARYGPATFLIATENGTIAAWDFFVTGSNAVVAVDHSASGAVYTGMAIAQLMNGDAMLYAANFSAGRVEMFNGNFQSAGSFTDTNLPADFGPFNIKNFGGELFVTFARRGMNGNSAAGGPGSGYIDVFAPDGTLLVSRFVSQGALNAPWGMALSPFNFGPFSHALLVGNFGDGRINAYDLTTGGLLGHLTRPDGSDLVIDGLWGLGFASELSGWGEFGFGAEQLYFTAGPNNGAGGVLGTITFNGPSAAPPRVPPPTLMR